MPSIQARYMVDNGEGWDLSLVRHVDPDRLDAATRPVLIVPGYGMNSFIFGYHPSGRSFADTLAELGLEVWRADLRGQGASRATAARRRYGLAELATADLEAATRSVLRHSLTSAARVDVIGASLGGSLVFSHAALVRDHVLGAVVAIGAPVRWVEAHPLLRAAFSSADLAGALPFYGTRQLARLALPPIARFAPWALSLYLNPAITDTRAAATLSMTVEDPIPYINRQIAHWIRRGDLILRGVNVAEAARSFDRPLLTVVAANDGIVPDRTASYVHDVCRSPMKSRLVIQRPGTRYAHADLLVSNNAPSLVFEPIGRWLREASRQS